jgi:hypothetical protein
MSHGEIKEKYVTHDERLEGRKEGRKEGSEYKALRTPPN